MTRPPTRSQARHWHGRSVTVTAKSLCNLNVRVCSESLGAQTTVAGAAARRLPRPDPTPRKSPPGQSNSEYRPVGEAEPPPTRFFRDPGKFPPSVRQYPRASTASPSRRAFSRNDCARSSFCTKRLQQFKKCNPQQQNHNLRFWRCRNLIIRKRPPSVLLKSDVRSPSTSQSEMSSRALLPQDDFSSLGLAATSENACSQVLDGDYWFTPSQHPKGGDSLKGEPTFEDGESYRPANFIPDEVYELIRNWELTYYKQQEVAHSVDSMETDTNSRDSVFEPLRPMLGSAPPPKRFYRTFWRSLTRRAVQCEKESTFGRIAMSSSDASEESSSGTD